MWTRSAISHQLSAIGSRLGKVMTDGRWPIALFGMPDYPRYLTHQRAHHPAEPVMSEKEFVRCELERKYAGGGSRCC